LDFYQHSAHKRESKFMYSSCKSKRIFDWNKWFFLRRNFRFNTTNIRWSSGEISSNNRSCFRSINTSKSKTSNFIETFFSIQSHERTSNGVLTRHDNNDEIPPPIATRPEKTKSIVCENQFW
jgi:hypothetical protein